ncbi:hypothetical protein TNIN_378061 [Trichonephila inaurata madagascariensis]|uniref:Retrovirus-related Pol polyprotein from transposon TNT 1-94-like beta-barrel domain-containing protein n=1 Tax=Trichonephila inaurata madagascariensis TaxID=2747483 RepID=A0A8X6WXS7_9ARAC|nr:hypothetical protein TNIN_378061 [Trichonephila inaurata madagascariensis]
MAFGHETVNIEIRINNKWERYHLTDVWYVPDISRNLFSINQTLKKGFKFQNFKDRCSSRKITRVHMKVWELCRGLYARANRVLHQKYLLKYVCCLQRRPILTIVA